MGKQALTDAERVRLRKQVEQREWLPRWRNRLSDPRALLDLQRRLHRVGCIDLAAFQIFKRQAGFYDDKKP